MSGIACNKIVVPVDFSDQSLEAVDHALTFVKGTSHLRVIHVLPVLEPAEPGVIWNTIDDEVRKQHATEALTDRLSDAKYAGVNVEVGFGDPGQEITEFARRIAADLIVLPSHGRTGIKRLLLGSVAERTIRLAHCGVLVLKK